MYILSNPIACKSVRTAHCNAFDAFLNHVETMHSQGKASFEAEFYVSLCQDIYIHTSQCGFGTIWQNVWLAVYSVTGNLQ